MLGPSSCTSQRPWRLLALLSILVVTVLGLPLDGTSMPSTNSTLASPTSNITLASPTVNKSKAAPAEAPDKSATITQQLPTTSAPQSATSATLASTSSSTATSSASAHAASSSTPTPDIGSAPIDNHTLANTPSSTPIDLNNTSTPIAADTPGSTTSRNSSATLTSNTTTNGSSATSNGSAGAQSGVSPSPVISNSTSASGSNSSNVPPPPSSPPPSSPPLISLPNSSALETDNSTLNSSLPDTTAPTTMHNSSISTSSGSSASSPPQIVASPQTTGSSAKSTGSTATNAGMDGRAIPGGAALGATTDGQPEVGISSPNVIATVPSKSRASPEGIVRSSPPSITGPSHPHVDSNPGGNAPTGSANNDEPVTDNTGTRGGQPTLSTGSESSSSRHTSTPVSGSSSPAAVRPPSPVPSVESPPTAQGNNASSVVNTLPTGTETQETPPMIAPSGRSNALKESSVDSGGQNEASIINAGDSNQSPASNGSAGGAQSSSKHKGDRIHRSNGRIAAGGSTTTTDPNDDGTDASQPSHAAVIIGSAGGVLVLASIGGFVARRPLARGARAVFMPSNNSDPDSPDKRDPAFARYTNKAEGLAPALAATGDAGTPPLVAVHKDTLYQEGQSATHSILSSLGGSSPAESAAHCSSSVSDSRNPLDCRQVYIPYTPELVDELELQVGDMIAIEQLFLDNWAVGENLRTQQTGCFPLACCDREIAMSVPSLINSTTALHGSEASSSQHELEFDPSLLQTATGSLSDLVQDYGPGTSRSLHRLSTVSTRARMTFSARSTSIGYTLNRTSHPNRRPPVLSVAAYHMEDDEHQYVDQHGRRRTFTETDLLSPVVTHPH